MIHHLMQERKDGTTVDKVLHTGIARRVDNGDTHCNFLRVKRGPIVEYEVDTLERGSKSRLLQVVSERERLALELRKPRPQLLDSNFRANEKS